MMYVEIRTIGGYYGYGAYCYNFIASALKSFRFDVEFPDPLSDTHALHLRGSTAGKTGSPPSRRKVTSHKPDYG